MRSQGVWLGLTLVLGGASARATDAVAHDHPAAASSAGVPSAHWQRVGIPEQAGFSSAKLAQALTYVQSLATSGLVVVVHGAVLLDYGKTAEASYLSSVRQSVLSLLYGNEVQSGRIRLDQTLGQLGIDDVGGLSAQEKEATVSDLLTARSGVYHPAANRGDDFELAPARNSERPGEYFLYSNWDFNALGSIFEQQTHRNLYDAFNQELAKPLGMEDFHRAQQHKLRAPARSIHAAYQLWLSTRDLARLGLLMLRNGAWNGQQLVPAAWIAAITRPTTLSEDVHPADRWKRLAYGCLWWVFDDPQARAGSALQGAYTAAGAFGQFLTVIPKLDMVISHKTTAGAGRAVSLPEYLRLVDLLVAAKIAAANGNRS